MDKKNFYQQIVDFVWKITRLWQFLTNNIRMAQSTQWLQAILYYMKNVMLRYLLCLAQYFGQTQYIDIEISWAFWYIIHLTVRLLFLICCIILITNQTICQFCPDKGAKCPITGCYFEHCNYIFIIIIMLIIQPFCTEVNKQNLVSMKPYDYSS